MLEYISTAFGAIVGLIIILCALSETKIRSRLHRDGRHGEKYRLLLGTGHEELCLQALLSSDKDEDNSKETRYLRRAGDYGSIHAQEIQRASLVAGIIIRYIVHTLYHNFW